MIEKLKVMIENSKARKQSLEEDIKKHNALIMAMESNLKKLENIRASMKGGIIEIDKTIEELEKQLEKEK